MSSLPVSGNAADMAGVRFKARSSPKPEFFCSAAQPVELTEMRTPMMPYYPVRDGHPSMFAPEDNAGAVSGEPMFSISPMSGSADGANDAARVIHNARIRTTRRKRGRKPIESTLPHLD